MKTKGIRILDTIDRVVSVELLDILEEIPNGSQLHWSIQFIEATGDFGDEKLTSLSENQVREGEHGYDLTWKSLNKLAKKFDQVIDILIIGCRNMKLLVRYENDEEMYETCDIVIEMIDSSFWQVFSKDTSLIERLAAKFKKVEFLESDFHYV